VLREDSASTADDSTTSTLGKRKRAQSDEGDEDGSPAKKEETSNAIKYEQFESSDSSSVSESSSEEETSSAEESSESSSSEESSEEESESEGSEPRTKKAVRAATNGTKRQNRTLAHQASSSDSTSSSSSHESESESSSEEESDSDFESESSTSTTSSDEDAEKSPNLPKASGRLVPPGQGSERTHQRNERKARVNKLKRLVSQGILPPNSTIRDLAKYETPMDQHVSHATSKNLQNQHIRFEGTDEGGQVKEEEKTAAPHRIDVAAVNRFIKAGLVGNDTYDREREEARVRGQEKATITEVKIGAPPPSSQPPPPPRELIPRHLRSKQRTASAEVATKKLPEVNGVEEKSTANKKTHTEQDPLISGFYEQVKLATKNRQARRQKATSTISKKVYPIIRAFECEPEWCGLDDIGEEETKAVEIDAPPLPFVDTYKNRRKSKGEGNSAQRKEKQAEVVKTLDSLAEKQILKLPRLKEPSEGAGIYFKSLFLHPVRNEPVTEWRWGVITDVDGETITIDVHGPKYKEEEDDEEMEDEVLETAEMLKWNSLLDVRYQK